MKIFKKLLMVCMLAVPFWVAAQTTVNGVISEQGTGFSLSDVSITNESTLEETFTDMDGNFSIQAKEGDRIVISMEGYDDIVVNYNNESSLNVVMRTASTYQLDDVVVIGYGTTTHKDATGSMVAVTEKDFNQGLNTAPEQLLTGKVAGLQVITGGGAPGTGTQIRIRNGASLNANNDPLFVIDGVPMDNGAVIAGSSNPLNFINPSDIESMSVLKDASATAIYGARASNGVIIITTKKGKKGKKLGINFNTAVNISTKTDQIDVLSGDQFRTAVAEMKPDLLPLLGTSNTDWQDLIYKTAIGFDNNLGITGMLADKVPFRVSLGYTDQDGILKTSNFKRTTGAIGLSPSLFKDHLKIDINVKGSFEENQFADEAAIGAAIRMDPTQSVNSTDGSYGGYWEWLATGGIPNVNATANPVAMLMLKDNYGQNMRSVGNIKFDYNIHGFEDLKATLNLGYDYSESEGREIVPTYARMNYNANSPEDGGWHKNYSQIRRNQLFDFYLNYNKNIASIKSKLDVTAGYSYQSFDYENLEHRDNYNQNNPDALTFIDETERVLIGFFGRLNYTFNEKYLLTATLRTDGSSRFAEDVRWGWFPSLALAWNVAEEGFLKDSKTVSNMKLRLGYGITGQENIAGNGVSDVLPYLPAYVLGNPTAQYPIGDTYYSTLRPNLYDPSIKWEETTTYNVGLDFGFLNNRIYGSFDVFQKETRDLLQETTIPMPALNNRFVTNVGTMEIRGAEVALGADIIRSEDFTWSVNFNATWNDNEITKLTLTGENTTFLDGALTGGTNNLILINTVGQPSRSFYVYSQVYDSNGNPLPGVFEDLDGDGVIDENDRRIFQSGRPDWTLGFNSNLNYKNWDLGFSMRANLGNYMYNNVASDVGTYAGLAGTNGFLNNVQSDALNTGFTQNYYFSDYYVQDASFLKMDYITLGYTLKSIFGNRTDMRFYGTVQNVFVITDYDGLDPESQITDGFLGIDERIYPRPRIFSLGVNVNF